MSPSAQQPMFAGSDSLAGFGICIRCPVTRAETLSLPALALMTAGFPRLATATCRRPTVSSWPGEENIKNPNDVVIQLFWK
mmetsp:Transcript_21999/g.61067  ORF Transcript_21999/g.61067 Transcript_21999/m.61067 type:complete len:81 (+) Transcript_21999:407-649(+)